MKAIVRYRPTGYPPPLEQITGQIRVGSGVTYGRRAPPPVKADCADHEPEQTGPHASFPDKMLAWLTIHDGDALPSLQAMAIAINPAFANDVDGSNRSRAALSALWQRGVIDVWSGRNHGIRGAYAVRTLPNGKWMKHGNVPADIVPDTRRSG